MWFGPDGTMRYGSAFPPPKRRRRWPLWVALGVIGALLLCVAPVVFVATRLPLLPADPAVASRPTAGPAPSPGPDAPAKVRSAWVTDQIRAALDAQAAALLSGDEKAFLRTIDPKASKVATTLKRRFASLRALKVSTFRQQIDSLPAEGGTALKPVWNVKIEIKYCLVVAKDCQTDRVTMETGWAETAAGLRLASIGESGDYDNGPRPWEVSALRVAVGKRVIVASTSRYASRLPALLRQAERAAAVADRFVIGGKRPDRYRVFVAGESDWKRWYGGDLPSWSVGFATGVSDNRMDVVLNLGEIQSSYVDEVLRHELGHVATLSADDFADESDFWLVEGIAEYIQESGRSVRSYDGRPAVRRYLNSGKWNGAVNVPAPTADTPDWQVAARYGMGYYAVRRMAEKYGEAKMIAFFTELALKRGGTLDGASRKAFGAPWATVNADCARYVRRQA
ncbi:MAG TPA: hypothetical protein VFT95_01750 [Micromonosporaceae bacterium]|nr:hypothetical protein [Micromonosporaceae bacterium]